MIDSIFGLMNMPWFDGALALDWLVFWQSPLSRRVLERTGCSPFWELIRQSSDRESFEAVIMKDWGC